MNILVKLLKFLCGVEHGKVNRTNFWSMVSTITTIILLIFAYIQLKEVNNTTHASFAHNIKNDFFTKANINLVTLIEEEVLTFYVDSAENIGGFNLDTTKYKKLHPGCSLNDIPLFYQTNEIDALLQNFEDFGIYEKRGLIDLDFIKEGYDTYITEIWNSKPIKEYIDWLRNDVGLDSEYKYFEYINNKLNPKHSSEIN